MASALDIDWAVIDVTGKLPAPPQIEFIGSFDGRIIFSFVVGPGADSREWDLLAAACETRADHTLDWGHNNGMPTVSVRASGEVIFTSYDGSGGVMAIRASGRSCVWAFREAARLVTHLAIGDLEHQMRGISRV